MLRLVALLFVAQTVACSPWVETAPHVVCRDSTGCLSNDDLDTVLVAFNERVSVIFDPVEPLTVYWFPPTTIFASDGASEVIGYTQDPTSVVVTSLPVLVHEVMHVHLWRTFPDSRGDADHENGPGPWTDTTNDAIRDLVGSLRDDYGVGN